MSDTLNIDNLTNKIDRLKNISTLNVDIIDKISEYITNSEDAKLYRINIYNLANDLNENWQDVLKHILYATKEGIFTLNWDVHCPHCNGVTLESDSLLRANHESYCDFCKLKFDVAFDESVEVSFTVHEGIKELKINAACIIVPQEEILYQNLIEIGTELSFELELDAGSYNFYCPLNPALGDLYVSEEGSDDLQEFDIEQLEGKFNPASIAIGKGKLKINMANKTEKPVGIFIVKKESLTPTVDIHNKRLTGLLMATIPDFKELFETEYLSKNENLKVKNLSVMFTDIKGSTSLYEMLGDAKAYNIVREHFNILFDTIHKHNGGIVKTIGDAVMAVFIKASDSVQCAYEVHKAFEEYNKPNNIEEAVIVKIGVNEGSCIVVNLNNSIDYFGTTVNKAARIQNLSKGGDILLSESIFTDPAVKKVLLNNGTTKAKMIKTTLRGLSGSYNIYAI